MLFSLKSFSQSGEWVWLTGDTIPNNVGSYGVQGKTNRTNNPPSLYEACEWTDTSGKFWLYGGLNGQNICSDLWRYDPILNEWTWMKGLHFANFYGSYGIKGVPSPNNNPPSSSYGMNSWVDLNGNFWMFGGSNMPNYVYSDMWKYDITTNEWTWMNGPGSPNTLGFYGAKGVSSPNNYPAPRTESSASWTDNNGDLWLFGGEVYGTTITGNNDLWKYNIASNEWTWVKGDSISNQRSIYGTRGVESPSNTPGGRWAYSRWKDDSGNLWLFGGDEVWNAGQGLKLDIWKFDVQTNNWVWVDGDSLVVSAGIVGPMCIMDDSYSPTFSIESRASWKDTQGNFWGFIGGWRFENSLWKYCPIAEQWAMIKADSSLHGCPRWGTRGVPSALNYPSALEGSIGWTDGHDNLYMFGGLSGCVSWSNALWKYSIDSTCGVCPLTTEVKNISEIESGFSVFPNPTNGTFEISLSNKSQAPQSEIEIYNILGEKVYSTILIGNTESINISLRKGIYCIRLINGNKQFTKKVIVE